MQTKGKTLAVIFELIVLILNLLCHEKVYNNSLHFTDFRK